MGRTSYSDEQRAEAVALYREHGAAEAARRTGVNAGTIRSWVSHGGVATERAEKTREALDAIQLSTEERRTRLGEKLLALAEKSTDRAEALIGEANLRDIVGALDYAIKNAQLLTGAATARTEHTAGKEAAHAVADELKARREKAA